MSKNVMVTSWASNEKLLKKVQDLLNISTIEELFIFWNQIVKTQDFYLTLFSKVSWLLNWELHYDQTQRLVMWLNKILIDFFSDIEVQQILSNILDQRNISFSKLGVNEVLSKKFFDQKYYNQFYTEIFWTENGIPTKFQILKPIIKTAIVDSLKITTYMLWYVKKSSLRERSLIIDYNFNLFDTLNYNKLKYAKSLKNMDESHLKELLVLLDKIDITNIHMTQRKERKEMVIRLKKQLIHYIEELNLFTQISTPEQKKLFNENIIKFVSILKDYYSNSKILTYYSIVENEDLIFDKLRNWINKWQIQFNLITCPDYSWVIVDWQFQYDFKELNTWKWIVTVKAIDFVNQMNEIISRYMWEWSVKIKHYLPTFEFPDGFSVGDKRLYDKSQCVERLNKSVAVISATYKELWINANVWLSQDVCVDSRFFEQKADLAEQFKALYAKDKKFKQTVDYCFKYRKELYFNWFPKQDWQTDEEYMNWLINRLLSQMWEYYLVWKYFTQDDNALLLSSDSRIMYNLYWYFGFPSLYGQSKDELDYVWA